MDTSASSPLGAYLLQHGMTQVRFAAESGVPQCQVSAYLTGRRKPGRKNALAIERATGGAVTVASWADGEAEDEGGAGGVPKRHERRLARASR